MRQQVVSNDAVLVLKGSGQLSTVSLLPSPEQFQIGGMSTVRGYPEGMLIGDHGDLVSAELNFPLPLPEPEVLGFSPRKALQGFVFADHGGAFPYKGNNESINKNDFLTGVNVGVGLNLNFTKYLSGKVSMGVPLQTYRTACGGARFYFYFQSALFKPG